MINDGQPGPTKEERLELQKKLDTPIGLSCPAEDSLKDCDSVYKAINEIMKGLKGFGDNLSEDASEHQWLFELMDRMSQAGLLIHHYSIADENLNDSGGKALCYSSVYTFKLVHVESEEFILLPAKVFVFEGGNCGRECLKVMAGVLKRLFGLFREEDFKEEDTSCISQQQVKRFWAMVNSEDGGKKSTERVRACLKENYGIDSSSKIKKEWYKGLCEWAETADPVGGKPANGGYVDGKDVPFE